MLGLAAPAIHLPAIGLPLAQVTASIVPPALLVGLCAAAAVGTILLLPSPRREGSVRTIGGIILAAAAAIFALLLINIARSPEQGQMGVYFWVFSAIALTGAVRVITHTKPVYSALYFVLTVLASAGLFVLLWAEFMAAALVLIYAGAILVTYVFVIMLAAQAAPSAGASGEPAAPSAGDMDRASREPLAACTIGFVLMGLILLTVLDTGSASLVQPKPARVAASDSISLVGPTQALGVHLFERHLVSLELAGLILTVAMVGSIMIARRRVLPPEPVAGQASAGELIAAPATPGDDNPHSIPVYGTDNPRHKGYPQT
jgi:NADH-quinone oxidoreductase subunit J